MKILENIILGIVIVILFIIVLSALFILGVMIITFWKISLPLIGIGIILGILMTIADV